METELQASTKGSESPDLESSINDGERSDHNSNLMNFVINDDDKVFNLLVDEYVTAPIESITNMNIQPGESGFLFWFLISSYFPVITACLGPLANSFSVLALVQDWRYSKKSGELVEDAGYLRAINALSLVFALCGNISLLFNFTRGYTYLVTQKISIVCWLIASILILVIVIEVNKFCVGTDPLFYRSEGFWLGVHTTLFYFCCSMFLIINYSGYMLKKYPPMFNLTSSQRTLMAFTIVLSIWLVIGSLVNERLIRHLTQGSALYYCTTSILTIGLGDITPKSTGAKIFILVYSLVGVLLMGLIITMITRVAMLSSDKIIRWHNTEKRSSSKIVHAKNKGYEFTPKESFAVMRRINRKVKATQSISSIAITIFTFAAYVFIGTSVFYASEGWDYFDAFYFCFLCLITIGYGDFHPISPFGRIFFVSWTFFAVPLMTILISDLGDQIFNISMNVNKSTKSLFIKSEDEEDSKSKLLQELYDKMSLDHQIENVSKASSLVRDIDELTFIQNNACRVKLMDNLIKSLERWNDIPQDTAGDVRIKKAELLELNTNLVDLIIFQIRSTQHLTICFNHLVKYYIDSMKGESKTYNNEEWSKFGRFLLGITDNMPRSSVVEITSKLGDYYWLDKNSPLRLPLIETKFFLLKTIGKTEEDIRRMSQVNVAILDKLSSSSICPSSTSAVTS